MRLHRLEITAFGPFAGHQRIDFDDLNAAGLFLLHGPTGAGKTSVLDAICFALYGRVPGSRGAGARYRSDHAASGVKSEVVCEFTVSGRRLEIARSPEWQRPKKRGTGFTREQAHVVVRERFADGWVGLTHRMDEAGEVIGRLVGLGPDQFTKLIMLPQGEFAAFLRASAEERRPLLQKLFGTDRFASVENWLGERRRESAGSVSAARAETARLYARACEAHGVVGGSLAGADPDLGDTEAVAALVRGWATEAATGLRAAHAAVRRAETAHEKARSGHDAATERLRLRDRRRELTAERDLLVARSGDHDERRARLQAAGHAPVLLPLLAELDAASAEVETAEFRVETARSTAEALHGPLGETATVSAQIAELRTELGALTSLLSSELELRRLDKQVVTTHEQVAAAETEREQAEQAGLDLGRRVQKLLDERGEGEVLASSMEDRGHDLDRAKRVASAVLRSQELEEQQTRLEDTLRAVTDVHQAAVAAAQELQARRLAGMAAELAAGLGRGEECPVCGSHEHPRPARHRGGAVTEDEQERAAEREAQTASRREKARQLVEAGRQQLAALAAVSGGADAGTAMADLAEAQERLLEAQRAALRLEDVMAELEGLQASLATAKTRLETATATAAAGREELAALDSRRDDLRTRLDEARGDDADLPTRHARVMAAADALTEYEEAARALVAALARLKRARAAADKASTAAGFASREAAAEAALSDGERAELTEAIADHENRLASVGALLDELARDEQAALEPPKRRAPRKPRKKKGAGDQPMLELWAEAAVVALSPGSEQDSGDSEDGSDAGSDIGSDIGLDEVGDRTTGSAQPTTGAPAEGAPVGSALVGSAPAASAPAASAPAASAPADASPVDASPVDGDSASSGSGAGTSASPAGAAPGTPGATAGGEVIRVRHWQPEPDLDALADELRDAYDKAREAHQAAQERHTLATRAAQALGGLAADLERQALETRPLRESFATLDAVSRCVEGTGADNQLRMRLSSYVLAARLEQVAQAASARLAAMSGGRYELVHTDGPSRGGARSGLGLAVVDGWTGVQRDPATLSGGETFCTSLALALGLADVVQAEAGGAVIETLLVDEGFGSLDQDTLDEVMDVLDGLRSGGRSVGLVSHVADLRDRIPAQVEVVKTRVGSQIRVGAAALAG